MDYKDFEEKFMSLFVAVSVILGIIGAFLMYIQSTGIVSIRLVLFASFITVLSAINIAFVGVVILYGEFECAENYEILTLLFFLVIASFVIIGLIFFIFFKIH